MRPKIFSSDTGENPCDLGLGKDFLDKLDKSLKEWSIQEKLMKFKTLFFERYCNGIKSQGTDWEKISLSNNDKINNWHTQQHERISK